MPQIDKAWIIANWDNLLSPCLVGSGAQVTLQQALNAYDCITGGTPPPPIQDMIPFNDVEIVGGSSAEVKGWPITTKITGISFDINAQAPVGGVKIDFDAKNRWPMFVPPGWEGPVQYTLWVFLFINGTWWTTGCLVYYQDWNGGNMSNPGEQMKENWYYYASPMGAHAPANGEKIGFMVTSSMSRRGEAHQITERSNIVTFDLYPQPHQWSF